MTVCNEDMYICFFLYFASRPREDFCDYNPQCIYQSNYLYLCIHSNRFLFTCFKNTTSFMKCSRLN